MAERKSSIWGYRFLFVLMCSLIAFIRLLPLNLTPGQIPGPDLIILIAFSWAAMRSDLVPVWLLAIVFLLADFLFMRPPGLWAGLALLGVEFLRARQVVMRNAPFFVEWFFVAIVVVAITFVNALVLAIFGVAQPSIVLTVLQLVFTILVYPVVVILAGRMFGLKKQSGQLNSFLGER